MAPERPAVYVFEHDSALAALLTEVLTGEGYPVRKFSTPDLPDDVRTDPPGLAIVAFPPDRPGRDARVRLISRLRDRVEGRLPVVGLTGDFELVRQPDSGLSSLPDFAMLAKPFSLDELHDVVVAMTRLVRHGRPSALLDVPPAVLLADETGRYRNANAKAQDLLGYSQKELRRLTVTDIMIGAPGATQQDWSRYVRERVRSSDTVRLRRKDGEEIRLRMHASVLRGTDDDETVYISWLRP